jgi:hypothetical protein
MAYSPTPTYESSCVMTLAEFLLARIADDEAEAKLMQRRYEKRVLAECDAKRRIVKAWRDGPAGSDAWFSDDTGWDGIAWCVQVLALPYKDHPDYRTEWKP